MEEQKETLECSVYAVKNTRRLMEDRHIVIPNLLSQFKDKPFQNDNHYSYYAIFDGHAGPDAAQYAADHLHINLVESNFFRNGNISDALRYAYATTDFQYTEKSLNDGIKSGCTAVTCLLENNKRLYMAWVGDSVALLSRNGKPYFIMEPHNLERDDEKERVENMGGTVIYFDTWRVNGTLSVSRAIGDPEYKPYVCSDPDIEVIELDGTEDFLIIGCDGLWDRMTPEDAIGLIYQHLQTNSHLEPSELVYGTAQVLSDRAIKDGSCDNVTTIVIFLRSVASILSAQSSFVPSSESSNYVLNSTVSGDNEISNNTLDKHDFDTNNINSYEQVNLPTEFINTNSNNINSYENGLIDSKPMDNGLNSKEMLAGIIDASEGSNCNSSSQEEIKSSSLNPFANEFQPNLTGNKIIDNQIGDEPKKYDEELDKNEEVEKKDLWMSEFKNDGNKEQQQHYTNQAEMLDGLVDNGLNVIENLSGNDLNLSNNLPSSQFEDNFLSSEVNDVQQVPQSQQEPTAPELISIEQEQYSTMETNVVSQAETFVGNLTPTEVPSSPVATITHLLETQFPSEMTTQGAVDYSSSQYSFDLPQSAPESNVNKYITSVSDTMSSEPYHESYFASDSVEPESILVTPCDDGTSSGPHAIDPYSNSVAELESDSKSPEEPEEYIEEPLNTSGRINIEDTESIPLESSTRFNEPFGSNVMQFPSCADPLEADVSAGDQTKSSFNDDTIDNSSALFEFSADQVNEIVITPSSTPNVSGLLIESKLTESDYTEQLSEQSTVQQEISQPEETNLPVMTEDLSNFSEQTSKLNLQDTSTLSEETSELIFGSGEPEVREVSSVETVAAVSAVAGVAALTTGAIITSKDIKKESSAVAASKTSVAGKSTLPTAKAPTRTTAAPSKPTTTVPTRKPLSTTSSSTTRTASSTKPTFTTKPSSATSKISTTSRPPTSSSTNVKSSITSRLGATSTLNKKSQTSTVTSKLSSLTSRTTTSSATSKPATRTTTTTTSSALSRRPGTSTTATATTTASGTAKAPSATRSTLTSRTTTISRTAPSSSSLASIAKSGPKETIKKATTSTATAPGTGTAKPAPKRASTGSSLSRPSLGASTLTNKTSSSALNRSFTNPSRPGATTTSSTLSRTSNRPTPPSTLSSTRSTGLPSRSTGAKPTANTTTKSTTSTNKVAVPRLGAAKKPTTSSTSNSKGSTTEQTSTPTSSTTTTTSSSTLLSSGIHGEKATNCAEQHQKTSSSSSPVDVTTINLNGSNTVNNALTNSIKRDKNMPNSANSLKDELEAALASPISCEDKGVIMGTKDDESSENL